MPDDNKAEVEVITLSDAFKNIWNIVQNLAHKNSVAHGWWDGTRNYGELVALMHSELSEALEYLRHGNPPSDHIPEFSGLEEELADVIIRIMDFADAENLRIPEAVVAKMNFNETRPYKHGNKKF